MTPGRLSAAERARLLDLTEHFTAQARRLRVLIVLGMVAAWAAGFVLGRVL